ncbi:MAG: hypothetical protein GXX90_04890 [Microbacteriaceae bacterium]|nr:hypothetical protein [Microbacteriaceae bacterium]
MTRSPLTRVADALAPAATAVRPAVLRLGIGAYSAINNGRRRPMLRKLHRQGAEQFAPVGPCRILKRPLPPRVADALFDAAQVVNALATLGVAHRVTGPLNSALQLWTLSYRNSWGMIFHNDNQSVLHQAVLGVSPAADALSVDALVARRPLGPPAFARRYGIVATACNVATLAVYFISGVAKVRSPKGWAWAGGDTLREQIAADAVRKEVFGATAPEMAGRLYRSERGFGLLGVGTLIVELGAPLALAHRRLGQAFALAAWGLHMGIRVVMGIKFTYNLTGVSYLPLLPAGPQLPPVRPLLALR